CQTEQMSARPTKGILMRLIHQQPVLLAASCLLGGLAFAGLAFAQKAHGEGPDKLVRDAEAKRIAVIAKIKPTVVAVFAHGGQGGGSGVLISKDGYALTNFHVVGRMITMKCGLSDGIMYDAVLVG